MERKRLAETRGRAEAAAARALQYSKRRLRTCYGHSTDSHTPETGTGTKTRKTAHGEHWDEAAREGQALGHGEGVPRSGCMPYSVTKS